MNRRDPAPAPLALAIPPPGWSPVKPETAPKRNLCECRQSPDRENLFLHRPHKCEAPR